MVLYVLMLSAMFIIRGKPYSGENICTVLISPVANCLANVLTSTLAFSWNVVSSNDLLIKTRSTAQPFFIYSYICLGVIIISCLSDITNRNGDFEYCVISIWKICGNVWLDNKQWVPILALVGERDRCYDAGSANSHGSLCCSHTELQVLFKQQWPRENARGKQGKTFMFETKS